VIIFDIETGAIDNAAMYLPPQQAPANYKDPDKIAAYIAEAQQNALAKAALDPGLLRIVAIGAQIEAADPVAWLAPTLDDERAALAAFWRVVAQQFTAGGELIGYNVLGFDLPALITRSWLLGVKPALSTLRRHGQFGVIDLMDRLSFGGIVPARSLAWWCHRIGIGGEDAVSGKDIPGLVEIGDWASIESHVLADVTKTAALAAWMGITHF
jgi:hypothetical protein